LSSGEKTSARLVAAALASFGLESVVVDPDTPYWPVITDDRHLDANPLVEECRTRTERLIIPLLEGGRVPVVCGFLGKTVGGRTTTLGRGGSDTTAVLLGNCLRAKEVILVKDVQGVYSSDPDKVTNPQFIESLNGEEAEMLAAGGAKFLHVKALRYQSSGLKIRVTNLDRLDSGTVIKGELSPVQVELLGEGVSMITFVGLDPGKAESIIRAARAVREAGGSLLALSLEANAAIFYVGGGRNVLDGVHRVLVEDKLGKAVSEFPHLSMITVKGSALETEQGVVQRIVAPLARASINVYGIVTILSSVRVFVSAESSGKALAMVKEAMIAEPSAGGRLPA
ncbi:MAG: aspartate kinase, partial [Nitrososphaerota archaeon]|nr:aspartate kinase [Nitrososphaerota archaeon]